MRQRPNLFSCVALLWVALFPLLAQGFVAGEPHRLYAEHRLFGGAVITGNTLTAQSVVAPQVNSVLLDVSGGDVRDMPFDAELEAAYLFWSGSIDGAPDRNVSLTSVDGARANVAADRCVSIDNLGGFFYCRSDVTDILRDRGGANQFNGTYFVGDVQASVGQLRRNGQCEDRFCQAKYAAWSLVLVYRSESARTLRDVFIHDGFRQLDEDETTPGVDRFTIRGFDFPEGGEASITFFGLEGDSFLGVPPQDTDPLIPCDTCFDYMNFSGERLSDALNPPNNLFNSSSPGGFTLGMDLDSFNVSDRLQVGQSSAEIEVGSGDGRVNRFDPEPTGGGESFFLGYVLLSVDRNTPIFSRDGTRLTVVPDEGAPNERVVFTLRVTNEGTRDAPNTILRLPLPAGLTYLPGSLRIDGADPVPGDEVVNPMANGLNLGNIAFRGDTDRLITFRATIDDGVQAGRRLISQGSITADNLAVPSRTNEAVLTVLGPLQLDTATKDVVDGNGDGRFEPGEVVTYRIRIENPHGRAVGGVRFVDDLPTYLDVLQVFATTGDDVSRPGARRVEFENMSIPSGPNSGASVTIVARVHDEDELVADGVALGEVNGLEIDNQGRVTAAGREFATTDPTPAPGAPAGVTRFVLSSEVDIAGPQTRKTAQDIDGGRLEPGDTIRFTVQVVNRGTTAARVFLDDALPDVLETCAITSDHPEILCEAGERVRGFLNVAGGETQTVVITASVRQDTPDGSRVRNRVVLSAAGQRVERTSPDLFVESAPDLSNVTKVAIGPVNGVAVPGQTYRYRIRVENTGNLPANNVVVTDPLGHNFAAVRPLNGGVYQAADNQVLWTLGALNAGENRDLELEVTLARQVADETVISNQVSVSYNESADAVLSDDPATAARRDPTRVRVRSQPLIAMTKSVDRAVAEPGQVITYRLTVRNDGTDAARGVTVVDPLPPGVFAEVNAGNARQNGDRLEWNEATTPALGNLDVGDSVTLEVRARLVGVLDNGRVIENQATADAGLGESLSDDPSTAAANDPTAFTVRSSPNLVFTKAVEDLNGGDPQPGDRLRYTLSVSNQGNGPALDVRISDPIPEGLIAVGVEDGGVLAGGNASWPAIPRLEPGGQAVEVHFQATADRALASGAQISNQARVSASDVLEQGSDDPGTAAAGDPTVVTLIARPDLSASIKRVEPINPEPGQIVTWFIQIVNGGTVAATNVRLVDALPLDLVENVVVDGGRLEGRQAVANFDTIPAGGAVGVSITATVIQGVADGTRVLNQAEITADAMEPTVTDDPSTDAVDDATAFEVRAFPEVRMTKTVIDENGGAARPGEVLRYVITANNSGTGAARDVVLSDALPNELTVVEAAQAEVSGRTVTWRIAQIPAGGSVERALRVRLASPLENGLFIANQAELRGANLVEEVVRSDDPTTDAVNDPTRVQVISAADFSGFTKRARDVNGPPLRPGDFIDYFFSATNEGDAAAAGVRIVDVLPDSLEVISTDRGVVQGQTVTFDIGAFPVGARGRRSLRARVRSPLANGTVISNQATIAGDGFANPFLSDDPATEAVDDPTRSTVTSAAEITLEKRVEPVDEGTFGAGTSALFILTVTNTGDASADGLELIDPLPAALVQPFNVPAPARLDGRTIRWPVPAVRPGQPQRLEFLARIAPDTPDGARVTNTASVAGVDASASFNVVNRPSLTASTKAVEAEPFPGGRVTYTLAITNNGSQEAQNVTVEDRLPEELAFVGAQPAALVQDGTLRWAIGSLRVGETRDLRVEAEVREGTPDGRSVSNQANISADGIAPTVTDNPATAAEDDPTVFTIEVQPELVAVKTVRDDNGAAFAPGDPITYFLTIRNTGAGPARNLEVIDPLPAGFEQASAVDGAVADGVANWSIETLAPQAERVLELRGRLAGALNRGQEISNRFEVRARNHPPIQSEPVNLQVQTGEVTPEKLVRPLDGGLFPGGRVEFTIRLRNEGESAAADVSVSDPLDLEAFDEFEVLDGGRVDLLTGTAEWSPEETRALRFVPGGGVVEVRLRARIRPDVSSGALLRNRAIVAVRGDPARPEAEVQFEVVGQAEYLVEKTLEPGRTRPGDLVSYRILVTNTGDANGLEAVLRDELPSGLEYVAGTTRLNGRDIPDIGGESQAVSGLNLGEADEGLGRGERVEVSLRARISDDATPGQRVVNRARVEDRVGQSAEGSVSFTVEGTPDISNFVKRAESLETGGAGPVPIGGAIRWTLSLTNEGTGAARDVRVIDPIRGGHTYVAGSLTLDGRRLTDEEDGDAGVVTEDIGVVIEEIAPAATAIITFETLVTAGPRVTNQAIATEEGGARELSDNGGPDQNEATVVEVGDPEVRQVQLTKSLIDREDDEVAPGEVVRFELKLENTGTVALDQVTITDVIPRGLSFVRVNDAGPEVTVDEMDGRVTINAPVDREQTLVVTVDMVVDPTQLEPVDLCNRATAETEGAEPVEDEACFKVVLRTGSASGRIFQEDDGVSGPSDSDLTFEGMTVRAYRSLADDRDPIAEAVTGAEGDFEFPLLPAGRYRFAAVTSTGTVLNTVNDVNIGGDEAAQVNIPIDPSGRVYDSVSGKLLDGAILRIYRDEDADDDPFDEESRGNRRLVDPDDLEHPSQQGQRTAHGGLYEFAVKQPGRYIIEIESPGVAYLAPSTRVSAEPGYAGGVAMEQEIVPNALPSVASDAAQTYYMAFRLQGPEDEYRHNHVPLDPLSSLIDLTKRAARTQVYIGDVVTYEVTLRNRSAVDLRYDPATGRGGVRIQDVLPKGLKYVRGSAVVTRVDAGKEVPLSSVDPVGGRVLLFGVSPTGERADLRALDFHAGETLRLRYQAIVDASAQPRRIYTNRVRLLAEGNVPISETAEADIRVLADPDFDQGLLIGRVFCDEDKDGVQGAQERGAPGIHLYMDHGYEVVTDSNGLFHFKDIDPGTHMVKVDARSLLPGAELTTDQSRIISFTRGLPARVQFGVTCPGETVTEASSEVTDSGIAAAMRGWAVRPIPVKAQGDPLSLSLGTRMVKVPKIDLAHTISPTEADGGALVVVQFAVPQARRWTQWSLWAGKSEGALSRVAGGDGELPPRAEWRRPKSLSDGPWVYRLSLVNQMGDELRSPAVQVGQTKKARSGRSQVARLSADGFGAGTTLKKPLKAELDAVLPQLTKSTDPISIRVHHDNSKGPFTSRSFTRRRARAVAAYLVSKGILETRVTSEGVAGGEPLWPNITARSRRKNRRIEIFLHGAEAVKSTPASKAKVVLGLREVVLDKNGAFSGALPLPTGQPFSVFLEGADGRSLRSTVTLKATAKPTSPRAAVISGTLGTQVSIDGVSYPLRRPKVGLTGKGAVPWAEGKPTGPLVWSTQVDGVATRWLFTVTPANGKRLESRLGLRSPPSKLTWTPTGTLTPGWYTARLMVVGATTVSDVSHRFKVGEPKSKRPAAQKSTVLIDGHRAPVDGKGTFRKSIMTRLGRPVVIDVTDSDNRWALVLPGPNRPTQQAEDGGTSRALTDATGIQPLTLKGQAGGTPAVGPGMTPAALEKAPEKLAKNQSKTTKKANEAVVGSARPENVALLEAVQPQSRMRRAPAAATMSVHLPTSGATLQGSTLPIRGQAEAGRTVRVNGTEMSVDDDGAFGGSVKLKPGQTTVEVVAADEEGRRTVVRRQVQVPDSSWFLMAMSEGVAGSVGTELDGVEDHTNVDFADRVYLHGRAVAWFRGYASGADILGGVFKRYSAEGYVDSARRAEFESAFRQLIDPNRFYPVYGDEAKERKLINTRGPLYVLLKADDSALTVGNFKTSLKGVELFRYDRAHYGAQAELDVKTGDFRHEVTAFGTDENVDRRHAYVEFRGTGGSLYYLPHRELVEGSERVYLVERDRLSGIERRRVPLTRDSDYRVRYLDGRLLFTRPVSSASMGLFGVGSPGTTGGALDGHPVYITVEYDHVDMTQPGERSMGVHARETWNGAVSVGGGYVQTGRENQVTPDYTLMGADLRLRHGRRTHLDAEFARSRSLNAETLRSDDGGLSFNPFHRRSSETGEGASFLLRGGFELDDLMGKGDRDSWYTEGYWQYIQDGFSSGGTIHQQGLEKYGGLSRLNFADGHFVHVRHDGWMSASPGTQGLGLAPAYQRQVSRFGYGYRDKALKLDSEFVYTQSDEGPAAPVLRVGALAIGAEYALSPEWTLLTQQEVVVLGDRRLHAGVSDLLSTTLGARYQAAKSLYVEALETVRWSGDNTTQVGLRTELDDRHSLYVQERYADTLGQKTATTVIGGEERFGHNKSGRAYGEYQLQTGDTGSTNRTVVGLGKRTQLMKGLVLDAAYERSQSSGDLPGTASRDAVSGGVVWEPTRRLALSGRYEFRYEDNEALTTQRDRSQLLALNSLKLKIDKDWSFGAQLNFSHTQDLELEATEAELFEANVGLAYRPASATWLVVLAKYTKRYEQRPLDLVVERPEREESDVVSFTPIFELPWRFQLVEKLALKRTALRIDRLPTVVGHTLLWINRLNYHLTNTWDAGVEYRLLESSLAVNRGHGALLELNYIIKRTVRLGVGYNFTSFSDDEFARFDETYGGPFFRVIANY